MSLRVSWELHCELNLSFSSSADHRCLEVMCDQRVTGVQGLVAEDQDWNDDQEPGEGGVVGEEGQEHMRPAERGEDGQGKPRYCGGNCGADQGGELA